MSIYIAKDGERIDQIVYEHYNSILPVRQVLEQNPHLLKKVTLDAGDKVLLNIYEIDIKKELPTGEGVAVWG